MVSATGALGPRGQPQGTRGDSLGSAGAKDTSLSRSLLKGGQRTGLRYRESLWPDLQATCAAVLLHAVRAAAASVCGLLT